MQDVFYDDTPGGDSPAGLRYWLAQVIRWGGALTSLALVAAIIIWAYRLGVRDARDIPVIRALDQPVRVQPADPGGTTQPHQGLEVNEILAGSEAQLPEASTPAPASLTLADEDQPVETAAATATDDDPDLPVISDGDAQAAAILQQLSTSAAARPRPRPGDLPADDAQPIAVAVEVSAAEIGPGTRLVQLGAFDSEGEASTHWRALVGEHTDLLALKRQYIQETESNGRTLYRLRVLGFDDANAQRTMCEALRARAVDCIPVTVR